MCGAVIIAQYRFIVRYRYYCAVPLLLCSNVIILQCCYYYAVPLLLSDFNETNTFSTYFPNNN
jgi:hypothetical protein